MQYLGLVQFQHTGVDIIQYYAEPSEYQLIYMIYAMNYAEWW